MEIYRLAWTAPALPSNIWQLYNMHIYNLFTEHFHWPPPPHSHSTRHSKKNQHTKHTPPPTRTHTCRESLIYGPCSNKNQQAIYQWQKTENHLGGRGGGGRGLGKDKPCGKLRKEGELAMCVQATRRRQSGQVMEEGNRVWRLSQKQHTTDILFSDNMFHLSCLSRLEQKPEELPRHNNFRLPINIRVLPQKW